MKESLQLWLQVCSNTLNVSQFVLSCRVFNRYIEHSFLLNLFENLQTTDPNLSELVLNIYPSHKNKAAQAFFESTTGIDLRNHVHNHIVSGQSNLRKLCYNVNIDVSVQSD